MAMDFNRFLDDVEDPQFSNYKRNVSQDIREFLSQEENVDVRFDAESIRIAESLVAMDHVGDYEDDDPARYAYMNKHNPNESVLPEDTETPKARYDYKGQIDVNFDIEKNAVIHQDREPKNTMDLMYDDLMAQFPNKRPPVQFNSGNEYAINFAKVLFNLKVKRWWLPLLLTNPALDNVDPFSPDLTQEQKEAIIQESTTNLIYYCREVVRIPTPAGPTKMKFHIGSFTSMYLTANDITYYLEQPRQTYKSGTDNALVGWCWNLACRNSQMALFANNLPKAKDNLQAVIDIVELLPSFMQLFRYKTKEDSSGNIQIMDCEDYSKTMEIHHKLWNNKIYAGTTGQTKEGAMKTGRGKSLVKIGFDEIGWSKYNWFAYGSAQPAHEEAAANADKVGAPHNITMTSTPPDATTKEGEWLYKLLFEDCVKFNLVMFDLSKEELKEYMRANGNKDIVFCSFAYNELGFTQEWLVERLRKLDREVFDVEVMLKWKRVLNRSPFSRRALELIEIYTKNTMRKEIILNNRFVFQTYPGFEEARLKKIVIGVDIAGGGGTDRSDYSTMVGVDPHTTKVLFTFRSNTEDTEIFSKIIIDFYRQYTPNAIIVVERTGIGKGVVDKLKHCQDIVDNLYYESTASNASYYINSTDGRITKGQYGLNNDHNVRETMTKEILNTRVNRYKTYFNSPDIARELMNLTVTGSGRIDHLPGYHDDVIMAYLMALYVLYKDMDMDIKFGIMPPNVPDDDALSYNKLDAFDIKIDPFEGLTKEEVDLEYKKIDALNEGTFSGFKTLEGDTFKRATDNSHFVSMAEGLYDNSTQNGEDKEITMGAHDYFGNGKRVNRLKAKSRSPW